MAKYKNAALDRSDSRGEYYECEALYPVSGKIQRENGSEK
jgi:hypothetical protein